MNIRWEIKKYDKLSTDELYNIICLRIEVFIVEQNCPYQDTDGKDLHSYHVMGYTNDNELCAYARIIPDGISYKEVSIGRLANSKKLRGQGIGKELMIKSMSEIERIFGKVPVRISAQLYLKKFYENLGFIFTGKEYLEDNIPHVEMLFDPK